MRPGDLPAVRLYGDAFDEVPAAVDPAALRRIRLHELHGGPVVVPLEQLRTWDAVRVARLP